MSNHTPEPWEIHDGQIVRMFNGTPQLVATCHYGNQTDRAADRARIVACVNALRGLDVEKVEALLDAVRARANRNDVAVLLASLIESHDSIRAGGGQ